MEPNESPRPRVFIRAPGRRAAVGQLEAIPSIRIQRGQGGANKFSVPGWTASTRQAFQFGDVRIKTPATTVVVEYESAAGLTNLVKYWPLLRSEPGRAKRFVIVHVFQVAGPGDYLSHRLLWKFVTERMTVDLSAHGLQGPSDWDARLFTYRRGDVAQEAIDFMLASI